MNRKHEYKKSERGKIRKAYLQFCKRKGIQPESFRGSHNNIARNQKPLDFDSSTEAAIVPEME